MRQLAMMIPEWVYNLLILVLVPSTVCYAVYWYYKDIKK